MPALLARKAHLVASLFQHQGGRRLAGPEADRPRRHAGHEPARSAVPGGRIARVQPGRQPARTGGRPSRQPADRPADRCLRRTRSQAGYSRRRSGVGAWQTTRTRLEPSPGPAAGRRARGAAGGASTASSSRSSPRTAASARSRPVKTFVMEAISNPWRSALTEGVPGWLAPASSRRPSGSKRAATKATPSCSSRSLWAAPVIARQCQEAERRRDLHVRAAIHGAARCFDLAQVRLRTCSAATR